MTVTAGAELRRLQRAEVQPYLGLLGEWLLPGALYGVHHTWPQLYRSDGDGRFAALFAGDRLLSHCAWRCACVHTAQGPLRVALLGSVATDPQQRGRGHASRLLAHAIDDCRAAGCAAVLLWAERGGLYSRAGFVPGATEQCAVITAAGEGNGDDAEPVPATVRLATVTDHQRLHELHERKPLRIARSPRAMSGLLTTPGMWTCVLERNGVVAAYACTGKGADLQNWWHEFGGDDSDVAALLPPALRLVGQREAIALLPPYRRALAALLRPLVVETATVAGPMVCALGSSELPPLFIDGLDSV